MVYKITVYRPDENKYTGSIDAIPHKSFYLTDYKCNKKPVSWCDKNLPFNRTWAYKVEEIHFVSPRYKYTDLICYSQNH